MNIERSSTNQIANSIIKNLSSQMALQEKLFEQISSNKKLLKASDDPISARKVMSLKETLQRHQEYEHVINNSAATTNIQNIALEDAHAIYTRIHEIAISAVDGTKTEADRSAMGEEVEQLLQRLIQVGNTTHRGEYLFAGGQLDTPAFRSETDADTGRVTGVFYEGDNFSQEVSTRDNGSVAISLPGGNGGDPNRRGIFVDSTRDADAFVTLIQLRDKLLNNNIIDISGPDGLLSDIQAVSQCITHGQVTLGTAQELLELDRNSIINQNAEIEQDLAQEEAADVAQLIMELNKIQSVYEAALTVGGRIMQSGLAGYL